MKASLFVVGLLMACDGYADLPLQLREFGALRVERADRYSEGPGLAQIALDVPSDALGPFVIVGNPQVVSAGAEVQAWAVGTCRGSPPPAPSDPAMRACLAVLYARGVPAPEPLSVAIVVESRADARRFTLVGTFAEGQP